MSHHATFLKLCLETAAVFSRELVEDEVTRADRHQQLPAVMKYLWAFTGHFFRWPEALLTRPDLPGDVRRILERNLDDELGGGGGLPHTALFSNMAQSIGVALDPNPKRGPFIQRILSDAVSLEASQAVGQFFANEATPKWRGFLSVLHGRAGADLEFFRVHANEDQHFMGLVDAYPIDQLPAFWSGVIGFAKLRATFMDGLRHDVLGDAPDSSAG